MAIINSLLFQSRDRRYTLESDVYRRQILTYKDGPRAERVKFHKFQTFSDTSSCESLLVYIQNI